MTPDVALAARATATGHALVTHPVGTNCHTCHARAGWPNSFQGMTSQFATKITNYRNPGCPDLRAPLNPNSKCLATYTLTDFQWIIPDRAIKD